MNAQALRDLLGLARARKDRDLAALEGVLARLSRLEAEIAELGQTHARDMAEAAAAKVPLKAVGRRIAWADQQIRLRRAARDEVLRAIEAARAAARISVAKHAAVEKLIEKAAAPPPEDGD